MGRKTWKKIHGDGAGRVGAQRLPSLLAVLTLGAAALLAGGSGPALGQENPGQASMLKPGEMLFRDDEILTGFVEETGSPKEHMWVRVPTNDPLTQWDSVRFATRTTVENYKESVAAAAGRITDPRRDQAVVAYLDRRQSLHLEVWDRLDGQGEDNAYDPIEISLNWTPSVNGNDLAVAAADLDRASDEEGYYRDEIVLAGVNGNRIQVNAIACQKDGSCRVLASGSIGTDLLAPGPVDVAMAPGDFDGDGTFEVAVAHTQAPGGVPTPGVYTLSVGSYDPESQSLHFSTSTAAMSFQLYPEIADTVDVVAGDFVIQCVYSEEKGHCVGDEDFDQIVVSGGGQFHIFETDEDLKPVLKSSQTLEHYADDDGSLTRMAAGIFHFEAPPPDGTGTYDGENEQLVIANAQKDDMKDGLDYLGNRFKIGFYWIDAEYNFHEQAYRNPVFTFSQDFEDMALSVAAGNFVGHGRNGDATSPEVQLVTALTIGDDGGPHSTKRVWRIDPTATPNEKTIDQVDKDNDNPEQRSYFVLAADTDGDSWILAGDPIHMVVDDYHDVKMLVQEPPKHVDYVPVDYLPNGDCCDPAGEWEVMNISGYDAFHVRMSLERGESLETSREKKTSSAVGKTDSFEASASFGGKRIGASSSFKDKTGYKTENSVSEVESAYSSKEVTLTMETNRDDSTAAVLQHLDVWMYPVMGYDTKDPDRPYGYYQVVIPGADGNEVRLPDGGMGNADWYQPRHENHNLLSYPYMWPEGDKWSPPDLGSFTIYPDDPARKNDVSVMAEAAPTYNQNMKEQELRFSETAGSETQKRYSKQLTESLDITAGVSAGIFGTHTSAEMGFSLDSDQSWEDSELARQESSRAAGLTISVPESAEDAFGREYKFMSVVYVTTEGVFKVAHAVDLRGSTNGEQWWMQQYNSKPDPALNLPKRFEWHAPNPHIDEPEEFWILAEGSEKNHMRGFFEKRNEPSPETGEYEYLPSHSSPVDGQTIRLCARVYNYSLDQPTGPFDVKFYYFLCNDSTGNRMGELMTQPGMTARVDNLGGMENEEGNMTEVCVPWDTTGLSEMEENGYGYRFEVHLDEKNEVDEKHEGWGKSEGEEWGGDPAEGGVPYHVGTAGEIAVEMRGGNNVGVYPWSNVVQVLPSAQELSGVRAVPRRLSLSEDALSIDTGDGFRSQGALSVTCGEARRLRVRIDTASAHESYFPVVFYDGDPRSPGSAIASETARGLPEGRGYVWTDWTPEEIGPHRLWVHIREDSQFTEGRNIWDFLDVTVTSDAPPVVVDSDETEAGAAFGRDQLVDLTLKGEDGARVWVLLEAPQDFPGCTFARPADPYAALLGEGWVYWFDQASPEAAELFYADPCPGDEIAFGPQNFTGFEEMIVSSWKGPSPAELELLQRVRLRRN